jgi:ankyrin repeat protein
MCLPETLDETYSRILDSIPGENKQNATRILQLLTYSKRPLSVTELVDAIAVDITKKPHFSPEYRMPDPDEILVYCSSLVIMVPISVNGYDEPVYDEDSDDDENEGSNEKFTDNKNSDDEFIHGANSGDEFTYDEDSDEDSEKYENSDSIYTDGQYSSEENMETMFVLQLAHFSVKEYLTSGRFRGSLSSELNETTARVSIAVVCLSYLLHFDRYLCRRKIVARFPFAKYCAGSWLHYAAAVESESSELTTLLENLFYHNQAAYRVCYRLYSPDVDSRLLWRYDKGTSQPAPALYYAARGNLYTTAKFLLDNGADVNAKGGCRSYALIIASNQGHEGIVQLLIERGADLSVFDDETYNALMEASSIGHTRIAKLLLEHGADVNARGTFGKTALTEATSPWRRWNTQMIRLLLDNGAYDTRSADHMSAVETASWYDHYEALGLLLERGADVYRQNKRFVNEALKTAHLREQKQILKLLLNKGADMYTATCVWRLFYKSVILGHQEMVRTFLEEAYIVLESYVFRPYGTLANFCASFGCTDLLRFIYKNLEKDIYAPELHGKTSLHLVAQSGDMETFEYLISLGADPTVLDAKGDGILCYAAMGGNLEIVNAILNSKLGSEQYSIHWSPLHWACRAGHAEVVELLLEEGLRSHLVATDRLEGQWSPLSIAVYAGKRQMLQSLPATSRSLLGIDNHGPEIRFNPSFGICYGCWLVGSW